MTSNSTKTNLKGSTMDMERSITAVADAERLLMALENQHAAAVARAEEAARPQAGALDRVIAGAPVGDRVALAAMQAQAEAAEIGAAVEEARQRLASARAEHAEAEEIERIKAVHALSVEANRAGDNVVSAARDLTDALADFRRRADALASTAGSRVPAGLPDALLFAVVRAVVDAVQPHVGVASIGPHLLAADRDPVLAYRPTLAGFASWSPPAAKEAEFTIPRGDGSHLAITPAIAGEIAAAEASGGYRAVTAFMRRLVGLEAA